MPEAAALKEETKAVAKRKTAEVPATSVASEAAAIISMIERAARDPQVDVEKLRQLFQMQQEATAARARTEFLAAFARLQAELPAVERKGTGHNSKKYARFEDFIGTIKKPLADHGFSLSFRIQQEGPVLTITGVLGHEAGHQESTQLPLPADTSGSKNQVQAWGSTISYGKRYVGLTLLGIATEDEDDDGKKAGSGETVTDEQASKIKSEIVDAGADIARFCKFFKIESIDQLPAARFKEATSMLDTKKRAQI